MSALILPSKRTAQPTGICGINRDIVPDGSIIYSPAAGKLNLVNGQFATQIGKQSLEINAFGIADNGYLESDKAPRFVCQPTTTFTLLAVGNFSDPSPLIGGDQAGNRCFQFRRNSGQLQFIRFNADFSSAFTAQVAYGSGQNVFIGVSNGTSVKAYSAVGSIGSATISGSPSPVTLFSPNGWYTYDVGPSASDRINLAALIARPLSDAEVASLLQNPWQIFVTQERIIYFDAGVSSGGGVDLAGSALANAIASGQLNLNTPLSGASFAAATANGALNAGLTDLSGSAAAIAIANGMATITTTLSGNAFNQVFAAGTLSALLSMSGTATGAASAQGSLGANLPLSGSAASSAAAAGNINLSATLSGGAILQALAQANLDSGLANDLSGHATVSADSAGLIVLATSLLGGAQAVAAGNGAIHSTLPLTGIAPVTVTGSAGLTNTAPLAGAALSVANGSGDLTVGFGGLSAQAIIEALAGGSLTLSVSLSAGALIQTIASAVLSTGNEVLIPDGLFNTESLSPHFIADDMTPRYQARSLSRAH